VLRVSFISAGVVFFFSTQSLSQLFDSLFPSPRCVQMPMDVLSVFTTLFFSRYSIDISLGGLWIRLSKKA